MFSFRTTPLLEQPDLTLRRGRLAMLCDRSCWSPDEGEYLFETVARKYHLKTVFFPASGLFDEGPGRTAAMEAMMPGTEFIPFTTGDGLMPDGRVRESLARTDAIIVSLHDIGSRFDPAVNTLYALFKWISDASLQISVYIIDSYNPSGRTVEGSASPRTFVTSKSAPGLPPRHGLTIGEIAGMFQADLASNFALHIISAEARSYTLMPWAVPFGEDRAGFFSATFYSGHYLWHGTNVSCGIGTSRPYERFGAPFMMRLPELSDNALWNAIGGPLAEEGLHIRWEQFTPQSGIYSGQVCFGFHMMADASLQYHSLLHSLKCIRFVAGTFPEDFRLTDDFDILAADEACSAYIKGGITESELREHIKVEEQKWIRKAKKYLLYDDQPVRIK